MPSSANNRINFGGFGKDSEMMVATTNINAGIEKILGFAPGNKPNNAATIKIPHRELMNITNAGFNKNSVSFFMGR